MQLVLYVKKIWSDF